MKTPKEIVDLMMENDRFSQWMGLEILEIDKGSCIAKCTVKEDMLNGFDILHGGITYSISDSLLAFAANAHGFQCVSIETSITHIRPVLEDDILTAKCTEIHRGRSTGIYQVDIYNAKQHLISKFKGTVSVSKKEH